MVEISPGFDPTCASSFPKKIGMEPYPKLNVCRSNYVFGTNEMLIVPITKKRNENDVARSGGEIVDN